MQSLKFIFLFISINSILILNTYSQELGMPPFKYYSPSDYSSSSRNWSIVADSTGVIYVANQGGVLRYDGVSWMKIELPKQQIAYWVEKDHQGNIYVGANGEFGILKVDENQNIYFESFLDKLEEPYTDFNVVWEIARDSEGVVFRSRNYLFRYVDNQLKAYDKPAGGESFDVAFAVKDTVYMRIRGLGLGMINSQGIHVLPNSNFFSSVKVNGIYAYGEKDLMIATRSKGLFIYSKQNGVRKLETNADDYLLENKIYDGHYLSDGNYAIATMANGVIIVTPEGKEIFRFDSSNGLKNNQTLYVREVEGQLWLGTKNGIYQLAYNAPVKYVEAEFGLSGQVLKIFQDENEIYVTCNDGIYQLIDQEGIPFFKRINQEVIVDCINIFKFKSDLYISSLEGVFKLKDNSFERVIQFNPDKTYKSSVEGIYLVSEFYYGIYLFNMNDLNEKPQRIPGINRLVKQIVKGKNDVFWVRTIDDVSYEIKLNFSASGNGSAQVKKTIKIPEDTYLISFNNEVLFVNTKGVYKLEGKKLVSLKTELNFNNQAKRIVYTAPLQNDRCLICYEDQLNSFYCDKFSFDTQNYLKPTGEYFYSAYEPTEVFEDQESGDIWMGGANGLQIFQPTLSEEYRQKVRTIVRQVTVNRDSVIRFNLDSKHLLNSKENDIEFVFTAIPSINTGKTLFQHKLIGYETDWSDFSESNKARYNVLPPGEYIFQVRSVSPYTGLTEVTSVDFNIMKPWYQTIWALVIYGIAGMLFIYAFYRIRINHLIKKQEELSAKVIQTTADLAKANSSLNEKNNALEKLSKFKSRFFANVSHDLRTPIMLLSGRIEMLKSDPNSFLSKKSNEYVQKLEEDSQKLVMLTDEIKELVKMEEGQISLEYKKVPLDSFFRRIVGLFDSAAVMRKIELVFESDVRDSEFIFFDPHYIERLMYNLIANSLKFTHAGGFIKVEIAIEGELLSIGISDSGVGIPEEDIKEIFDRNFQAKNQHGMSEGLGIGLNLVKEIVGLHNGEVAVESTLGKGSSFAVYLPLNQITAAPDYQIGSVGKFIEDRDVLLKTFVDQGFSLIPKNISKEDLKKKKLLLVEDNPSVRTYMKELVEDDYSVFLAGQGLEALEILKKYEIDVIVTDLMMPVMDGFDFLKGVKASDKLKSIPVLVVSARDTQEDKYEIMKLGVNNIINKPFDKNEFLLRIGNLIGNKDKGIQLNQITENLDKQHKLQLDKLNQLIIENVSDYNFKIGFLAEKFHLSERSFFRMIKNITNKSPLEYVKDLKFQYAYDLLKNKNANSLKEIANAIGMKNTSDFNKQFLKRYGKKADSFLESD